MCTHKNLCLLSSLFIYSHYFSGTAVFCDLAAQCYNKWQWWATLCVSMFWGFKVGFRLESYRFPPSPEQRKEPFGDFSSLRFFQEAHNIKTTKISNPKFSLDCGMPAFFLLTRTSSQTPSKIWLEVSDISPSALCLLKDRSLLTGLLWFCFSSLFPWIIK